MMGMLTVWEKELPESKEYRHDVIEKNRTGYFNDTAKEKAFTLKELLKELFTPVDQDNKDTNPILENLALVVAERWIEELLDPTKVTYMLMSESGGAHSWDMASDELKKSLFGLMAVNNLAESVFEGLTAQLEVFERIGLANAAEVSDMQRNAYLNWPNLESNEVSLYFGLPEELRITATMTTVKLAPAMRKYNSNTQTRFKEKKRERDRLVMQEGNDKMTDRMIDRLIYRRIYESDRAEKGVEGSQVQQVQNGGFEGQYPNALFGYGKG